MSTVEHPGFALTDEGVKDAERTHEAAKCQSPYQASLYRPNHSTVVPGRHERTDITDWLLFLLLVFSSPIPNPRSLGHGMVSGLPFQSPDERANILLRDPCARVHAPVQGARLDSVLPARCMRLLFFFPVFFKSSKNAARPRVSRCDRVLRRLWPIRALDREVDNGLSERARGCTRK